MQQFYHALWRNAILLLTTFCFFSELHGANTDPLARPGEPVFSPEALGESSPLPPAGDPAAPFGHLRCIVETDTNCVTKTVKIGAFLQSLFTNTKTPVVVTWSTGQTAQSITVNQPGTYTYNTTGLGCDHFGNTVDIGEFFPGPLNIEGPLAICSGGLVELTVNTGNYTSFSSYQWNPPPFFPGQLSPYQISSPGLYSLTVTDEMGCTFTDQFNLPLSPPVLPNLNGPQFLCPEGSTGLINVTPAFAAYEWDNGTTTNPLQITEPGIYQVTVTNQFGCTGNAAFGVQSGGVENVNTIVSSPSICPGQLDTLRAFATPFPIINYKWSTNQVGATIVVGQPGTYTVTVTNIYGCKDSASITITPTPPPLVQVNSPYICPGANATLTATGAQYSAYQWSNGLTTPTITVSNPGPYSVTVSIPAGCTNTASGTVTIDTAAPQAIILPPGILNCTLPLIPLDGSTSTNDSIYQPAWTTPNGNIASGQNSFIPSVNAPGTYILTVTNTVSQCVDTDTVTVAQNIQAPPADAGSPNTLTCAVVTVPIGPPSAPPDTTLQLAWTTNGGNFVSGQNTWNPTVNQPGAYYLVVTNPANGCTAADTVQISQNIAAPVVQIAQPDTITCTQTNVQVSAAGSSSGPNFSYAWTTANGSIVSGNNTPTITVSSAGTYNLVITNTQNGCTSGGAAQVSIDANIPVAQAALPDTLTCAVNTITLNGAGSTGGAGINYQWTTAGGNIVSGANTLTPTVNQPGQYTLTVENTNNNCVSSFSVNVPIDVQAPLAEAGPTATLNCTQPSLLLNGSGSAAGPGYSYNWSTTNGAITNGANTLTPEVILPGTYTLVVTDLNNGCTATDNVQVQQDANAPSVQILQPAILTCAATTVQINAAGSSQGANFSLQWTGPPGSFVSGQNSLQPVVNTPGQYNLLITNTTNGCTQTASVNVGQDIAAPGALAGPDGLINCFNPQTAIGSNANPAGPNITYQWSTTDGNIVSGANSATPTVNQAGNYQLLVTNTTNGCTSTDQMVVTDDFTPPLADAGNSFQLNCQQPTTTLQGTGSTGAGFTYQWTTANGVIVSGQNTLTPQVSAAGDYTLLVTNTANGCTATDAVAITQSADAPVAIAGPSPTLTCALISTNLNAAGSSAGNEFSYVWTTANGQITGGANTLTPTVAAPGTYVLTVFNALNGCQSSAQVTVNQNITPPVANAGASPTLTCAQTTASLNGGGSSTGAGFIYQWSTTNGQIVSGANTLTPTVGAPGLYTLLVTNNQNGCTQTASVQALQDIVPPLAAAAVNGELTCTVTTLPLSGTGSSAGANFTYQWSTANGQITGGANTLTPTVSKPGQYNLLVTNTLNGCTQTAATTVTQNITAPQADAGTANQLTCTVLQTGLSGTGSGGAQGVSYAWSGPGIVSGANTATPQINAIGNYTLTVTDQYNGCTAFDAVLVTQNTTPPLAAIAPPAVLTCAVTSIPLSGTGSSTGANFSYAWNGPGVQSGGATLNPTVNQPGQYTLLVTNTQNGCTTSTSTAVPQNIQPPAADAGTGFELSCTVEDGSLNGAGSATGPNITYLWTTAGGSIVSGANSLTPLVDAPGQYTLLVTNNQNGCTATDQVQVTQNDDVPTDIDVLSQKPLCGGRLGYIVVEAVEGGTEPYLYSIDGGATFNTAESFLNLGPGQYNVVIQDANGCTYDEQINFPTPVEPDVNITPEITLQFGADANLTAQLNIPLTMVDTIIWDPVESLTFTNKLNVVTVLPFQTTRYTVTVINLDGCEDRASVLVRVEDPKIWAPNAITTLGKDGDNDYFTIFAGQDAVRRIKNMQVYDRWGTLVFQAKDIQPNDRKSGWDGYYRDKTVNPAVFVWWAEVELSNGEVILMKGDVTVVD